jgi:hypothetical protein
MDTDRERFEDQKQPTPQPIFQLPTLSTTWTISLCTRLKGTTRA